MTRGKVTRRCKAPDEPRHNFFELMCVHVAEYVKLYVCTYNCVCLFLTLQRLTLHRKCGNKEKKRKKKRVNTVPLKPRTVNEVRIVILRDHIIHMYTTQRYLDHQSAFIDSIHRREEGESGQ